MEPARAFSERIDWSIDRIDVAAVRVEQCCRCGRYSHILSPLARLAARCPPFLQAGAGALGCMQPRITGAGQAARGWGGGMGGRYGMNSCLVLDLDQAHHKATAQHRFRRCHRSIDCVIPWVLTHPIHRSNAPNTKTQYRALSLLRALYSVAAGVAAGIGVGTTGGRSKQQRRRHGRWA